MYKGHIPQTDRSWVGHPCCRQCRKFCSKVRNTSIRHKSGFHVPNANLTNQQKHVHYAGTKLCNALQPNIKILNHNTEVFMPVLKGSLLSHLQNLLKEKVVCT